MTTTIKFRRSSLTWLLYGILGWYAYVQGAINPLMPLLRRDLDLSFTLSSLHPAAFALGMITAGLTGERVLSRFGMRAVLWGGSLGMVLGVLLLVSGTVAPMTIAGAYVMGVLGTVAMIGVQTSLVLLHGQSAPVAITEANILGSLTAAAVPLAIGFLEGSGSDWRWALLLAVAVWLALFALQQRAPLPSAPPLKHGFEGKLPFNVRLYLLIIFVAGGVEWGGWLFAADYLIVSIRLDTATAAGIVALFPLGAVTGRVLLSRLLRRQAPQRLLPYTMLCVFVGFPLFYVPSTLFVQGAGLFLMGLGAAGFFPLAVSTVAITAGPLVSQASSRVPLATGTAILINPLLLGALADTVGLETAYLIVPTLAVVTLGMILFANRLSAPYPTGAA
jgi:fucose permease